MVSPGIVFTDRRLPAFSDSTVTYKNGKSSTSRSDTSYLAMTFKKNRRGNSPVKMIAPNWPWRTPLSYGVTSVMYGPANQSLSWTDSFGNKWKTTGFYKSPPSYQDPHTASGWVKIDGNLAARAQTEALLKLNNGRVNYGSSIGEAKSTIRDLGGFLKDLSGAYFSLRRGDVSSMLRHLGQKPHRGSAPANAWLAYQYAWMPLFKDIHGAVDDLTKGLPKRGAYFTVVRNVQQHAGPDSVITNSMYKVTGSSTYSCRCKLYVRMGNEQLANLSTMGLLNPLAVAWELVPYSFVVDWVLPVGNVLNALTAPMGLVPLAQSTAHRVTANWSFQEPTPAGKTGTITSSSVSTRAFERQAGSGFPLPRLYWKSPWSGSHVTSALSLINNLAKSKFR